MAPELLVDSSAWYPIAIPQHPLNRLVSEALTERVGRGARLVTTNLMIAEAHGLLATRRGARLAMDFLRNLQGPGVTIVYSTSELEQRAVTGWLIRYRDQAFSLTDAVSFEVMAERGIREALTLDKHFAIAGFVMVPAQR